MLNCCSDDRIDCQLVIDVLLLTEWLYCLASKPQYYFKVSFVFYLWNATLLWTNISPNLFHILFWCNSPLPVCPPSPLLLPPPEKRKKRKNIPKYSYTFLFGCCCLYDLFIWVFCECEVRDLKECEFRVKKRMKPAAFSYFS